jgi:hypothetical protein
LRLLITLTFSNVGSVHFIPFIPADGSGDSSPTKRREDGVSQGEMDILQELDKLPQVRSACDEIFI